MQPNRSQHGNPPSENYGTRNQLVLSNSGDLVARRIELKIAYMDKLVRAYEVAKDSGMGDSINKRLNVVANSVERDFGMQYE